MKKIFLIAGAVCSLVACQQLQFPSKSKNLSTGQNKFTDQRLVTIYTLQDERKTAELLPYLQDSKAVYRKEAALAFASVQDTLAIPPLLSLLSDTTTAVRLAAAYALGQIGDSKSEAGLIQHIKSEKRPVVQAALLEALGKIATTNGMNYLGTYEAPNQTALAGQAWGLYRAGLRQQYNTQAIEQSINMLQASNPLEARLAAAHFVARSPKLDLTPYLAQLQTAATTDASAEVRMAVAQSMAKVKAPAKSQILSAIVTRDPDYRVRLSAVRAMAGLPFREIEAAVLQALKDPNINTAVATAEFLQANPAGIPPESLLQALSTVQDARVRGGMIWVILRNSQNKAYLSSRYQEQYRNARLPYDKAHLLKALSGDIANYGFISSELFATQQPVIATAGMEAIITMRQQTDFPRNLEQPFADIFKRAVGSGDVALVGMAASAIRDPKLNLRSRFQNDTFLKDAQQKLVLPRDMETNIELQKTLDYLAGIKESPAPQNPFTHPIDWALVKTIAANQLALIRTEKGDITIQLFVEDAPGSVANFVELTNKSFFNDLYFHRVVPNFVAQGGDKRGDGWGSSDYSIRSEFAPLNYREGYLGMASAGKDTESNQWFITHSPAPHLDGRYTIFAKVVTGMDVVHQLEVGDRIVSVELK
ncbi:peptidylprolyl isomerase [Pontibacter arcticus]|uniref:peptidylprolyl isomerase n=1 Tax=Pontibacter arcticus TaxID=2080288 RepID=A0A364RDG6_9BACT|nr:peptidylprolyl isomerase [Pontibacter arcticus]RAU82206.1 hypothetical protein DP923_10435 [Pontibacter arcticus]